MARELLGADEVESLVAALDDGWSGSTAGLKRTVAFPTFLLAVDFVSRMAPIAEAMNHHPDLALSWRTVELTLSTHSAGGVTALDGELARSLDAVISELGGQ